MADLRVPYYGQLIEDTEFLEVITEIEQADRNLAIDHAIWGILSGLVVTQRALGANLSVDVSAGTAYDAAGQRIRSATLQNVEVDTDDFGASTNPAPGMHRCVSVFIVFARANSDPRTDRKGDTVYWQQDESFSFSVRQGSDELLADPLDYPLLDSGKILLADIEFTNGMTQVLNASISTARRQDHIVVPGAPHALRRGLISEALADLLGWLNSVAVIAQNVRVTRAMAFVVLHNTSTPVEFAAETYDTANFWAVGDPETINVPAAGKYRIAVNARWAAAAGGTRRIQVFDTDGNLICYDGLETAAGGEDVLLSASSTTFIAATKAIIVYAYQTSGWPLNLEQCELSVERVE